MTEVLPSGGVGHHYTTSNAQLSASRANDEPMRWCRVTGWPTAAGELASLIPQSIPPTSRLLDLSLELGLGRQKLEQTLPAFSGCAGSSLRHCGDRLTLMTGQNDHVGEDQMMGRFAQTTTSSPDLGLCSLGAERPIDSSRSASVTGLDNARLTSPVGALSTTSTFGH